MNQLIKIFLTYLLIFKATFAATETESYTLEDIYQFTTTDASDLSLLIAQIDKRASFSWEYFESLDNLLKRPSIEISITKENVSVEEFENEVQKVMYNYDIKNIRSFADQIVQASNSYEKNEQNTLLLEQGEKFLKSLFENSTIGAYLASETYKVNSENDVIFSEMEDDIYFMIANIIQNNPRYNPFYINYRCATKYRNILHNKHFSQSNLFYRSGSPSIISQKIIINTARIKKEKLQTEPNIFYGPVGDIYDVAIKLKNIEDESKDYPFSNKTDYAYFIMPGSKDDHAYFTTAIIDITTKKTLAVFLINSRINEDYRQYLGYRLNLDRRDSEQHIPFIEASLDLQLEEDDLNCAFYTANFSHAMIDLISDNRNELDQLTKLSNYNNIVDLIRNKLPAYLPQYYEKNEAEEYIKRSSKEIKAYHIDKRWKLSLEDIKSIIIRD